MEKWVSMPKVELHAHLNGSIRDSTLLELARGLGEKGVIVFSDFEHVIQKGPGAARIEGNALRTAQKDGVYIGEPTTVDWLYVYPQGMEKMVTYIKERYNNTPMFITDGYGENSTNEERFHDVKRVEYMRSYSQ